MEVARVQPAGNAENQPLDNPPTVKFTWTIENFTRLTTRRHYSDEFIVDDYNWRILLFPKGEGVNDLSIYLEVPDASSLPNGWSRENTQFSLLVVDQINNMFSVRKDTQHQFNVSESDWGFRSIMSFRDLNDSSKGYLVNDTIVIEAEIVVTKKGTSLPRASPLPDSRDVDDEVTVVEPTPVIDCAPVPICLCPSSTPVVPPSLSATSSSLGTAAPPASIALPDDDDSDLALFESIGITLPISKPSWSTTFDTPTSSATNAKIPTSKRAEILKALSTVVCYLHNVSDVKDVDLNTEPPLEVSMALETLKAQGSDLLPKEKITMISKLSTDLARTVSRYKVRHDLLQGIAADEKDIEACTKAFDNADATIKTMSTDYWQARQQRDAKRKDFALAEDKVSRLQAELARAQEQASELQFQLTEAEQRRLTSFRACADFKDTVYESARIERERVAQSLERHKALYAQEKDDLDNAHDFLLDVISCLDTEVEASWPGLGISV